MRALSRPYLGCCTDLLLAVFWNVAPWWYHDTLVSSEPQPPTSMLCMTPTLKLKGGVCLKSRSETSTSSRVRSPGFARAVSTLANLDVSGPLGPSGSVMSHSDTRKLVHRLLSKSSTMSVRKLL